VSDIEDLIKSRQGAQEEGERRQFSVDRGQAIRKMRQFALADPSYYLLELIQAAIANDGGFMNIDLFRLHWNQDDLKMWWSGRGFSNFELVRLFDFLLVSEDEPGCADTILLARGVNAMLHFEPARVVIASGDGTLDGSTQVVITGDGEIAEQQVPEAVDGVRIHGERLNLSLLKPGPNQTLGDREVEILRDKVIAPGVQVMLNGHFVSDWNSAHFEQRHWGTDSIEIDEDDLYGKLWVSPFGGPGEFDIMTWGVKIERLEREGAPFSKVYGAVNFNRLNKTADHAKIVRDEVLDELWARLRPYADGLKQSYRSMHGGVTYGISRPDGTKFAPPELVELIRTNDRAVVVLASEASGVHPLRRARDIGRVLDVPVLVVPENEYETLEMLAGDRLEFVEPRLDDDHDMELLTQPATSPPPRPWLVEPMKVEPISAADLASHVCEDHEVVESARIEITSVLGARGSVHMRVYSPDRGDRAHREDLEPSQKKWVKVLVCEREVFRARYPTAFPGHELVIDLPSVSPSWLVETVISRITNEHEPIIELVAKSCVQLAQHRVEEAHHRAEAALRRLSGQDVEESQASIYIDEELIQERTVRGSIGLPRAPVGDFAIELLEANSGRVHKLRRPAGELRLVGELVAYDDRILESKAWLEEVTIEHGERLLERLVRRLPRIEDAGEREQVARALLEFAGQKLTFRRAAAGKVDWEVDGDLARRILEMPIFPGRRRIPVSPMTLIRHVCARENVGRADHSSGAVVAEELLAEETPASAKRWIETYINLSSLEDAPLSSPAGTQMLTDELSPARLLVALGSLLEQLRPDVTGEEEEVRDFRVSWVSRETPDEMRVRVQSDHIQVHLDPEHLLVKYAMSQASPESMAWLILAIYAEINARLEPVTNDHELTFQCRVADALEGGVLTVPDKGS
jgi:hypothetical protein